MAILQGAQITGSIIATTFIKANGFSGSITASRLYVQGSVGIGTTSPVGKLHIVQNNAIGRYSYFGSNSGLFIKANDNSINSLLILENTQPAANYGVSINFNLGYGGDQVTAGTSVLGSRIVAAEEQTWTSTESTQDAYLAFHTTLNGSSSEKVRITSDGNVGIGTTSPTAKLEPYGTGWTSNAVGSGLLRLNATDNYPTITFAQSSTPKWSMYVGGAGSWIGDGNIGIVSHFGTEDATRVKLTVISGSGNVGIGTTNPGALLAVNGNAHYAAEITIKGSAAGSLGNSSGLRLWQDSSVDTSYIYNYYSGPMVFGTTNTERMRILSDGNVGIGISSPTQKLEVQGNIQAGNDSTTTVGFKLTRLLGGVRTSEHTFHSANNSPWYTYGQNLNWTGELAGTVESTQAYRPYIEGFAPAAGYKIFGFMDVSSGAFTSANIVNSLILKNDGNVGIGTTSPSSKLHLSGTGTTELRLVSTTSNTNSLISFYELSLASWGIDAGQANGSFFIKDLYNTRTVLTLNSSGNVGIGTTRPAARLHVNSSTMIVGDTATTQNVRQTIVGSTTGNASTTAKKIFVCGHTSTGTINVTAIITSVSTASATATFSFANAYGSSATPNRLSYISLNSTITSIDCNYNNTGYQMEISVTYTGATAPTLYFTAEGMGSSTWTL